MKILVVEDERDSATYIRKGLMENGFVVDLAESGEEGLHLLLHAPYDLAVLDLMLPDRDGWSVLRELRRAGRQTPVLILTARDAVPDRVKGLDLGADDYMIKPFAFTELLARIRTIMRRGPGRSPETLRIADLEIDLTRHRASRRGKRLNLTPKEFALLSLLVRHVGEPLSRTVIAEQVWDMNFDSDTNVIDVHLRRLRSKVDDPFPRKLIHTERGIGYVLEERQRAEAEGGTVPVFEAMAELWARFEKTTRERLSSLEEALDSLRAGRLGDEKRRHAARNAHKLAGGLGTFGLKEASSTAREIEEMLEDGGGSARRLGELLHKLERVIASTAPGPS